MVNVQHVAQICLTSLIVLAAAPATHAHQDPGGDVHPVVIGAPGLFQVCFYVAAPNSGPVTQPVWFRTLHKPDGTLLAPRHRILDEVQIQALNSGTWRRGPQTNGHTPVIQWSQLFSPVPLQGRPPNAARLVLRSWRNNAFRDEPLLFDAPINSDLTSQLITESWAGLLWSKIDQADDRGGFQVTLNLTWFWRERAAKPVTRRLGPCATIYDFAVASNFVWTADRLWVAWIRDAGKPDAPAWETKLSSFDPKTGNVASKALPGISNWNSHLSLATTDGWLCAAWHCTKDGTYPGEATIITAFEKIPPLP
jgi:hypothetical protein